MGIEGARPGVRGVFVPQTLENVYKINYLSRIATRVLWPLAAFNCPNPEALYRETKKIPWLDYLDETKTFAIDANISHPLIRHSLYGAQLVKDAICDLIREKKDARPSIDVKNPNVQLNLYIHKNKAILSLDTSGLPLYKRGWKEENVEAGLPETLAAALLMRSGYTGSDVLCDPFCGAGTLLIEAACIASQTPAGFYRKHWGFYTLPGFDLAAWEAFKQEQDAKRHPLAPGSLIAADKDPKAIAITQQHLRLTGFDGAVQVVKSPVGMLKLTRSPTLIVTDPPFGKRMDAPTGLFTDLGRFFRTECPAAPFLYMLAPSYHLVKATGCKPISEWAVNHGGLTLTLYQLTN
ncbi:MAG: 50S rRNA methyltransferase [Verrucomicrobia bacterium]|nr:50S rRNA methyltransferase [Verrucomicrobiota bacterium]